jgi:RHS repeat-associated protein
MTSITLPEGSVLNYEYNGAHELIAVSNGLGERIEYTLDLAGNQTGETIKSATSTITKTISRTYDELSRLLTVVGAGGQTTAYEYDTNGNITKVTDGNLNSRDQGYDALNRLVTDDAPLNHSVDYFYDGQNNLTQVTDPRGLATTFSYDGFGNLKQQDSPDSGLTDYSYDDANNRLSQTDGKGVTTTYTYDALNRLLTISYPSSVLNIYYTYDQGIYGEGRLTGISDGSGTTSLDYDHRGNLISQTTTVGTASYTLSYVYNLANQLTQISYPSGRSVGYSYGAAGLINQVETTFDSSTKSLASNLGHLPFGPLKVLDYGNGIQLTGSYDGDYRLDLLNHGAVKQTDYGYDDADNITSILDNTDPSADQGFNYDELDRLTNAIGIYGELSYSYDENSNRLSFSDSIGTDTYIYDATSHRLLSTNDWNYSYEENGNRISKLDNTGVGDGLLYTYDNHNRLAEVIERKTTISGRGKKNTVTTQTDTILATYTYNAFGQRVTKSAPGQTTHYVYGPGGQLMVELDDQGATLRDYIFLSNQALAVVDYQQTQNPPSPGQEVIIDNGDAGTSFTGTWTTTNSNKVYNGGYALSDNTGNTYRWTPTNLNDSNYEVYARWPGVKKHNTGAQYTINHNGETTTSSQDQSSNGKQWVLLGTYTFSGSGSEHIELSDLGGKTAADAIRLVEVTTTPAPTLSASLYYSHNDHLGTPQVFTDQNQNVVWQADYQPFGEVSESVNIFANNLRFAGQYFDEESNLHYNYFRDYDPGTGRYVQSDPIGLRGGLNTYGYVGGNPLKFVDPLGLVYGLGSGPYSQANTIKRIAGPTVSTNKFVFGCVGIICNSGNTEGAHRQFVPPSLGGGFMVCTKPPAIKECRAPRNPTQNGKGDLGLTYGKAGLGITAMENGVVCLSLGLQIGLPGPVIGGGDATIH